VLGCIIGSREKVPGEKKRAIRYDDNDYILITIIMVIIVIIIVFHIIGIEGVSCEGSLTNDFPH
jgi:hypothetical protein